MSNPYIDGAFFSRLETQSLHLRSDLIGFFGGKHRTNRYGQTVEFADYREYMLGDDIRRIDWNLYSRFEKYYIRLFTDERQVAVNIYIDCSASMGRDISQKGQYAVALGAGLGFLAVHSMDKVSFKPVHEKLADDSGGTVVGKSAFFRSGCTDCLGSLFRRVFRHCRSDGKFLPGGGFRENGGGCGFGLCPCPGTVDSGAEKRKRKDPFGDSDDSALSCGCMCRFFPGAGRVLAAPSCRRGILCLQDG